jgi:signal transduction histidine kinase
MSEASPLTVAALLRAERDEILRRWIDRVRDDPAVPRANGLAQPLLVDHTPRLLDDIANVLDGGESTAPRRVEAADHHGEQRYEVGYTLSATVMELSVLRMVILELLLERAAEVSPRIELKIHALIDQAIAASCQSMERASRLSLETERDLAGAAREAAERAVLEKNRYLAVIAHEMRNPLNAILGWCALARKPGTQPVTIARALATIERNATLQRRLIEDLLDLARAASGKMELEPRPIDAGEIVRSVVEELGPDAIARGIEMSITSADPGAIVYADPERLQQVVTNLLRNGLKFTKKEGTIDVRVERHEAHVAIVVTDTGVGIAPALLPQVFEPFLQGDPHSGRRGGGLGLGLALVRHLVHLHGGRVTAASAGVGRGAAFTVVLPLEERAPHVEP